MIEPPVFVTRQGMLDVLTASGRGESALLRLRKSGIVSSGLAIRPRDHAGKLGGRMQFYCSLNQDAVRLYLAGKVDEAKVVMQTAARIESRASANIPHLDVIVSNRGGRNVFHEFKGGPSRSELQHLKELAKLVEQERTRISTDSYSYFRGTVVSVSRDAAVVATQDGRSYSLSRATLHDQDLDRRGCAVEIHVERVGPGLIITRVTAALDFDETDPDRESAGMFGPPSASLSDDDRATVQRVLDGPSTIPVTPIEIPAA